MRELPGESEELERGLTCLGDVTQQQGGESLGQRAPKGNCSAGSFVAGEFVLICGRCWGQFHRICKVGRL